MDCTPIEFRKCPRYVRKQRIAIMGWHLRAGFLLLFLSLIHVPGPAGLVAAQESDEKTQWATKLIELHEEEGYLERALAASVEDAPESQRDAMQELIAKLDQEALTARWQEKVEEIFTVEEIKAYVEFMSTDVGRSILRKNTEIAKATQEVLALEILAAMNRQ